MTNKVLMILFVAILAAATYAFIYYKGDEMPMMNNEEQMMPVVEDSQKELLSLESEINASQTEKGDEDFEELDKDINQL